MKYIFCLLLALFLLTEAHAQDTKEAFRKQFSEKCKADGGGLSDKAVASAFSTYCDCAAEKLTENFTLAQLARMNDNLAASDDQEAFRAEIMPVVQSCLDQMERDVQAAAPATGDAIKVDVSGGEIPVGDAIFKRSYRASFVSKCIKDGLEDMPNEASKTAFEDYCNCTADRLLGGLSKQELIEIDSKSNDAASEEAIKAKMLPVIKPCLDEMEKKVIASLESEQ